MSPAQCGLLLWGLPNNASWLSTHGEQGLGQAVPLGGRSKNPLDLLVCLRTFPLSQYDKETVVVRRSSGKERGMGSSS